MRVIDTPIGGTVKLDKYVILSTYRYVLVKSNIESGCWMFSRLDLNGELDGINFCSLFYVLKRVADAMEIYLALTDDLM